MSKVQQTIKLSGRPLNLMPVINNKAQEKMLQQKINLEILKTINNFFINITKKYKKNTIYPNIKHIGNFNFSPVSLKQQQKKSQKTLKLSAN